MVIRWIFGVTARSILSPTHVLCCLVRPPPLMRLIMINYYRSATKDQILQKQLRSLHSCKQKRSTAEQYGSLSFGKVSPDITYWAKGILPENQNMDFRCENLKLFEKNTIEEFDFLTYTDVLSRIRYLVVTKQYICHDLLQHLLADAAKTFRTRSWNPDSIAQIMFCAFVVGNLENSLFRDVERHILFSHSHVYNAKQNILLLKACIRCRKTLNVIILRKIRDTFNSVSFDIYSPQEARFLQSAFVSYMACLPLKDFEKVFLNEKFSVLGSRYTKLINQKANTIQIAEVCCYIKLFKRARFYHRPLLLEVIWYINRDNHRKTLADAGNVMKVRRKDLANICWALASFGMKGKNVHLCYDKLLEMYEQHTSEENINSYLVTSNSTEEHGNHELKTIDMSKIMILSAFTVAGRFDYDLIDSVLRDEVAESCLENSRLDPLMTQTERLLLIQASVDLECPDYKGSKLSPAMVETLRTEYNLQNKLPPIPFNTRATHSAVQTIFPKVENIYHINDQLLCLDDAVEFRYDRDKGFVPFTPMSHEELQQDTESTTKRIAIVIARANRESVNGGKALGWFLLQLRLLRKLNYTVIRIPYKHMTDEEVHGMIIKQMNGVLSGRTFSNFRASSQRDSDPGESLFLEMIPETETENSIEVTSDTERELLRRKW